MSREWKPGDVVIRKSAIGAPDLIGLVVSGCTIGGHEPNWHWHYSNGGWSPRGTMTVHRPLVVIDPEDREAVERLRDLYEDPSRGISVEDMQAALREFANPKPPKPEEPTGLGAVVEDADGRLHVRTSGHIVNPWRSEADGTSRSWARVAAVRVLSEGVQP